MFCIDISVSTNSWKLTVAFPVGEMMVVLSVTVCHTGRVWAVGVWGGSGG